MDRHLIIRVDYDFELSESMLNLIPFFLHFNFKYNLILDVHLVDCG